MAQKKYFPIIISSPSGGGKSTVCDELLARRDDIAYSISYTTRKPRNNENDGEDYYFISEKKFNEMLKQDVFAEWAKVHGNLYGTSKEVVENILKQDKHVILDIDTKGAEQLMSVYPESLSVFLFPPSMKELEKRLRKRETDSEATIQLRLKNAKQEFADATVYDYLIINDDIERIVNKILNIIDKKSLNK